MRYRILWAILALVLAVPSTLLGQVIVKPTKTACVPCVAPVPAKKVAPKPRAVSKPVVAKQPTPPASPATVVQKPNVAVEDSKSLRDKEIADSLEKRRLFVEDSLRNEAEVQKRRAEWLAEYNLRLAAATAGDTQDKSPKPKERGWWSHNWGWPVSTAVAGTVIGIVGSHYHWWGGRNITQCVAVDSPGFCSRYK